MTFFFVNLSGQSWENMKNEPNNTHITYASKEKYQLHHPMLQAANIGSDCLCWCDIKRLQNP